MVNSFSQFLVEEDKTAFFTFGRMNPPTVGHGKMLDALAKHAGRNPYKVFVSQSQDAKKNPLSYSDKVKHARKMFPKHARNVMINKQVRNALDAATELHKQGHKKLVMVVGDDRVNEFQHLLNKYNGKESRHGFYHFKDIKVMSAGHRDPDGEGVEGASATKQRGHASKNDFVSFAQSLPHHMSTKDSKKLFNDVRKGMGLKEEVTFKNHIALKPVSDTREAFIEGKLFELGDKVVVKESEDVGTVTHLGSNYVIVEFADGSHKRKWLDAVELVEPKNEYYEWGKKDTVDHAKKVTPGQTEAKDTHTTKDGKQAKKGLWYNIHQRRKKGLAPLKPGAKNYPKTLDIEQTDMVAQTKDRIKKEKEQDKKKHDMMLTRAKVRQTLAKAKASQKGIR